MLICLLSIHVEGNIIELNLHKFEHGTRFWVLRFKEEKLVEIDLSFFHLIKTFEAFSSAQEDFDFQSIVRLKRLGFLLEVFNDGKSFSWHVNTLFVFTFFKVDETYVRDRVFVFFVFDQRLFVFDHCFVKPFLVEFPVSFLFNLAWSLPILTNFNVFCQRSYILLADNLAVSRVFDHCKKVLQCLIELGKPSVSCSPLDQRSRHNLVVEVLVLLPLVWL